jgi:hypothetical protein
MLDRSSFLRQSNSKWLQPIEIKNSVTPRLEPYRRTSHRAPTHTSKRDLVVLTFCPSRVSIANLHLSDHFFAGIPRPEGTVRKAAGPLASTGSYNSPYLSTPISLPQVSPSTSTLGDTASTLTSSSKLSPTSSRSASICHSAAASSIPSPHLSAGP